MTKKPPVIHPFLMAVFPVLSLFAHGMQTIPASETVLPSAVMLGFASVALLLLRMILGDARRAGMIVFFFLLFFFSYGYVFVLIHSLLGDRLVDNFDHVHLLLAWALVFGFCAYAAVRTAHADRWTVVLNVVAVALIAPSLIRVGSHSFEAPLLTSSLSRPPVKGIGAGPPERCREDLPDIYYIVPDRYASASTLEEQFDFDNSAFMDYLRERGFYVADESYANYPKTFLSLASSLNMQHLTHLPDELGRDTSDQRFVNEMLQDYAVWRFLRARGYNFMHFGTWWGPMRHNKHADLNFAVPLSTFSRTLYKTTILYPIGVNLDILDLRWIKQRIMLRKFDELAGVPEMEGPKFVFVHLLLPHPPYLFGPGGERLSREQVAARTEMENYLHQLAFTNEKLTWLIDRILEKSEPSPIIILQADEGPCNSLEEFEGTHGAGIDWSQLSDETIRAHMRILNAYHLPDADAEEILYPSVTPVNTFRILFDHYFDTDYGLLEDDSYIFENRNRPYSFIDVTDTVTYD